MKTFFKKVHYQIRMIRYLCGGEQVNKYRVLEQVNVLFALFGLPLKDKMLEKHLHNLNVVMKNQKMYERDMKRMGFGNGRN